MSSMTNRLSRSYPERNQPARSSAPTWDQTRYSQDDPYEAATLHSEISMSIVTEDPRYYDEAQRAQQRLQQGMDKQKRPCGSVNVEPVIVFLAIALGFLSTSQPLFTYWARCVEIAATREIDKESNITTLCAMLASTNGTLQDDVEKDISTTKIWLQVASSIPTLLIAPLVGNWSDKRGRKSPLIYTICGFVAYSLMNLIATLTYTSMNIYIWLFMAEFVSGITGGVSSIFAMTLAIVTDDCRESLNPGSSSVPMRIGIYSFIQTFGSLIGTFAVSLLAVPAISSISGHHYSYIKCAVIQTAMAVAGLLYAIFFVKETHFPAQDQFAYQQFDSGSSSDDTLSAMGEPEPTVVHKSNHVLAQFKAHCCSLCHVLMERRPGWTRLCLCITMFFIFVEFLALDTSLLFLLLKRQPFSWSDKMFSYYSLVRGAIFALGMVLCPLLLSRVRWLGKDSLMIIIGVAASATTFFLISQATTTEEIFFTCAVSLLIGGISPGYRSFLPRMVPKEQTARLLTIVSIILAFCPILSAAIFNNIFNWTLHWWPGFAFLIGGFLQLLVVFGQIGVHMLMRPQWLLQEKLKEQRRVVGLGDGNNFEQLSEDNDIDTERSVSNTAVNSDDNVGSLERERNIIVT